MFVDPTARSGLSDDALAELPQRALATDRTRIAATCSTLGPMGSRAAAKLRRKRHLEVYCDVLADPVWENGCSVTLESLPLSPGLIAELRDWAKHYTAHDGDDAYWTDDRRADDAATGTRLRKAVQSELGGRFRVTA